MVEGASVEVGEIDSVDVLTLSVDVNPPVVVVSPEVDEVSVVSVVTGSSVDESVWVAVEDGKSWLELVSNDVDSEGAMVSVGVISLIDVPPALAIEVSSLGVETSVVDVFDVEEKLDGNSNDELLGTVSWGGLSILLGMGAGSDGTRLSPPDSV